MTPNNRRVLRETDGQRQARAHRQTDRTVHTHRHRHNRKMSHTVMDVYADTDRRTDTGKQYQQTRANIEEDIEKGHNTEMVLA